MLDDVMWTDYDAIVFHGRERVWATYVESPAQHYSWHARLELDLLLMFVIMVDMYACLYNVYSRVGSMIARVSCAGPGAIAYVVYFIFRPKPN